MKLLKAALVALVVLGAGLAAWRLVLPEDPLQALISNALPASDRPAPDQPAPVQPDPVRPAEPEVRVYYQFVDDAGAVRMVGSLAEVPADRRARAGRIEMPVRPPTARLAQAASQPEIVIYTTSWCGFCRKMIREMKLQGLTFRNRDIERDSQARDELLRLVGSTGVPVTVFNDEVIRGYDPAKLRRLMARAN